MKKMYSVWVCAMVMVYTFEEHTLQVLGRVPLKDVVGGAKMKESTVSFRSAMIRNNIQLLSSRESFPTEIGGVWVSLQTSGCVV